MNPELSGTINGAWMPTAVFDKSLGIDQSVYSSLYGTKD